MSRFGLDDALVLAGLVVLGVAIWMAWGTSAVVAFAGAVLVTIGVLAAWMRSRYRRPQA
jgi:hypothetical protein